LPRRHFFVHKVTVPDLRSASFLIVAVDGGAASGKSSLARALAQRFNFLHVDTGSHYRAVTLALRKAGVAPENVEMVDAALQNLPLTTRIEGRAARIALGGKVPDAVDLRAPEVNANVSKFAALPAVRRFLFGYQRSQAEFAQSQNFAGLVMEGRDIGSVIFPDAPLRLFLTADPTTRAQRRAAEGQADAVAERDRLDSARATAPLTCPPGAIVIDSSRLSLEDVVARASALVEANLLELCGETTGADFSWFYRLVWHVSRGFMNVVGRAEAQGTENIPCAGPFILASNHASFLDPLLAGCFLPRPIRSFARKTLWNSSAMAWILDNLGCIPVDRDGESDVGAFKRVMAVLKSGEGVLIYPEGTRTRDGQLQPARRGVGLLAGRLGIPVVPTRVFGTFETLNRRQVMLRPFYRVSVTYGPMLTPREYDPGPDVANRYDIIAGRIMDAIAALPPPRTGDK
jgi:CMP/dCMP kinase